MIEEAKKIISEYESKLIPLDIEARRQWFQYSTTGDKAASAREAKLRLAIRELDSDKSRFEKLRKLYGERGKISDQIIRREIEYLYLSHLPNQIPSDKLEKLTYLEKCLTENFNDYRTKVGDRELVVSEVEQLLAESTDNAILEEAWKGLHLVAFRLEEDFRELVKLRNEIARGLGFENALELSGVVDEMDLPMLDKFYKDVIEATDKPFRRLKDEFIDLKLAKRFGMDASSLMPWHYQNPYFQEAPPAIFGVIDLDSLYEGIDSTRVISAVADYYESFGVDVRGILNNSSLFPKPGKYAHACAELLDPMKPGSSVLIMSLPEPPKSPLATHVATLAHELGHDINYEAIIANPNLPYILRDPTMLTEAFSMLMERQTLTIEWFRRLGIDERKAKEALRSIPMFDYCDQLVFLRWAAVIFYFERKFYANPDCDIGDLWWEAKERFQYMKRPKNWRNADALGKYHVTNSPPLCYSNYAIGRIANVQFAELFAKKIGEKVEGASYFDKKELGDWFMKDFLAQGERYRWDDFLVRSTGKALSVEAWKRYYLDSDMRGKLYRWNSNA